MYNTPHGLANAVIIPYVLEAYGKKVHKKLKQMAVYVGLCDNKTSQEEASKLFIESIKKLNESMGIGNKIEGIKKEDIENLSQHADKEANPIYPVPVLMDKKELQKIYYKLI
jgi:alcohol dehydrogenase class IV